MVTTTSEIKLHRQELDNGVIVTVGPRAELTRGSLGFGIDENDRQATVMVEHSRKLINYINQFGTDLECDLAERAIEEIIAATGGAITKVSISCYNLIVELEKEIDRRQSNKPIETAYPYPIGTISAA